MKIAERLHSNGKDVDLDLVRSGALLHDVGRGKTHEINHGVVGADIARGLGLSESIIKIIERHIGGGIPADEAEDLGLPPRSYMPVSIEEKIVSYADKLVERGREVDINVTLRHYQKDLGTEHPAVLRLQALHEEMVELIDPEI